MEIPPRKGLRSKYTMSGVQLDVLAHLVDGWVLRESEDSFLPLILQKGGIGSGLARMNVRRPSLNALLRKELIRKEEGESGAFIVTELGHEVLKAFRSDME